MKKYVLSWLIVLLYIPCESQSFFKKNLMSVSNDQLVLNNYSKIKIAGVELNNYFNAKNPYTYLLLIGDEFGNSHQLIYQTNFTRT